MKPTTDNSKMPNSEIFKERFLATAKNKEEILNVLNENKDAVLKTLNRKGNTWFFSSPLLSLLFFVAVQPTFVKRIIHPLKTI